MTTNNPKQVGGIAGFVLLTFLFILYIFSYSDIDNIGYGINPIIRKRVELFKTFFWLSIGGVLLVIFALNYFM